jgi:hypothetical protein
LLSTRIGRLDRRLFRGLYLVMIPPVLVDLPAENPLCLRHMRRVMISSDMVAGSPSLPLLSVTFLLMLATCLVLLVIRVMLSCVIICFESFFGLLYLNLNACMFFLAFVFNFGNYMTTCSCLFPILHYLFWKFAVCLYVNLAVHSSLHKGLEATSRNVSHRWTTL